MKMAAAIVMGLFSGFLVYMALAMMFMGKGSYPTGLFILITFVGGWITTTWLLRRGARTLSRVLSRGFLVGAAEWLFVGLAGLIASGRAVNQTIETSTSSEYGNAGAMIGGGLAAGVVGGVSVAMAVVCLIGFAVSHFLGREMKRETAAPSKKCPECAEMIQGEAKRCRYCGATIAPAAVSQEAIP